MTYYDWEWQPEGTMYTDLDEDYRKMYNVVNPSLSHNLDLSQSVSVLAERLIPEPSWQLASQTTSSPQLPGVWSKEELFYLWDIGPLLPDSGIGEGDNGWLNRDYSDSYRPFHLAQQNKIRSTPVETRTSSHNGDPNEPVFQRSTYFSYETFFGTDGDFRLMEDTTNRSANCDTNVVTPPTPSGWFTRVWGGLGYCFGGGDSTMALRVTRELDDDLTIVQNVAGKWYEFPVVGIKTIRDYELLEMVDYDPRSFWPECSCGVVLDKESKPRYFGTFHTTNGDSFPATDIVKAPKNYGQENPSGQPLTDYSVQKNTLMAPLPHTHDDSTICRAVHSIVSDSLLFLWLTGSDSIPGPTPLIYNFVELLDQQFFLKEVHVQADTIPNMLYRYPNGSGYTQRRHSIHNTYEYKDPDPTYIGDERYTFSPNFATIQVYKVHERDMYGRVVLESDSRRLFTEYEYAQGTTWVKYDTCGLAESWYTRPFLWSPVSVTVHDGRDIEHVSIFEYDRSGRLRNLIAPNGEKSEYKYDDFGRMTEGYFNGQLLAENQYHQWQNNRLSTYFQRTVQNYVTGKAYDGIHLSQPLTSVAYLEPSGRASQAITGIQHPTGAWRAVYSGEQELDGWGRTVRAHKPWNDPAAPSLAFTQNLPAQPYGEVRYEKDSRSRPLRAVKPGEPINGPYAVTNEYAILNYAQFQNETGITHARAAELFPILSQTGGGIPVAGLRNNLRIFRTKITDEDGKSALSYTDALGRNLATMGNADRVATTAGRSLTLFVYNSQGLTSRVIHPRSAGIPPNTPAARLETTTKYNHLGLPYEVHTPDQGTRKMMYNQGGDLVMLQDENLRADNRYLLMKYDRLGRVYREMTASLSGNPLGYEGTPGFRLTHTIMEDTDTLPGIDEPNCSDLKDWQGYLPVFPCLSFAEGNVELLREVRYDFPVQMDTARAYNVVRLDSGLVLGRVRTVLQDQANTIGRVAAEWGYDHVGNLIEMNFHSYDSAGRLTWFVKQFNHEGIGQRGTSASPSPGDRADLVLYPDYDWTGKLLTRNLDVNCDGLLDLQQHFKYDAFGRLFEVYASDADVKDQGTLLTRFYWDDATGLMNSRVNFVYADTGCVGYHVADSIQYGFDVRDRLTGIHSQLMTYDLFYDGQSPNSGGPLVLGSPRNVLFDKNRNGNINGWKVQYHVRDHGVTGFDHPTTYGFQYDGLNRLTHADASVEENLILGFGGSMDLRHVNGDRITRFRKAWYGDARYSYDPMGNFTGLDRWTYFAPGTAQFAAPGVSWEYRYLQGTGRLQSLNTENRVENDFSYDGNGNTIYDRERGLSGGYSVGNLPVFFAKGTGEEVSYYYGAGQSWVYKEVQLPGNVGGGPMTSGGGKKYGQYYLRDASGVTLAILDGLAGGTGGAGRSSKRHAEWDFLLYGDPMGHTGLIAEWTQQDTVLPDSLIGRNLAPGGMGGSIAAAQKRASRNRMMAHLAMTAPTLIPVAVGAAEGGLGLVALPVMVLTQPLVAEISGRLAQKTQQIPFPADPRGYESVADSSAYTLLTDLKFYLKDHLGNTRVTYVPFVGGDPCEVRYYVESVVDYYPYGKELRTWFALGQERYLSTEHERDFETGLDYRGARMYDAEYGRFLGVDPLAGAFVGWTGYHYVHGNPVGLVDPTGAFAEGDLSRNGNFEGSPHYSHSGVTISAQAPESESSWAKLQAQSYAGWTDGGMLAQNPYSDINMTWTYQDARAVHDGLSNLSSAVGHSNNRMPVAGEAVFNAPSWQHWSAVAFSSLYKGTMGWLGEISIGSAELFSGENPKSGVTRIGIGLLMAPILKGGGTSLPTRRVGQWMSKSEYDGFLKTGLIPRSNVLVKGKEGYLRQAAKGDYYVEFDINSSLLMEKNNELGWMLVKSKNQMQLKLAKKRGISLPEPIGKNIKHVYTK